MPEHQSHYPAFDVLKEKEHWDSHTREIVTKRLDTEPFYPLRILNGHEGDTLSRLSELLLDDDRQPIIAFVVHHIDSTLQAGIGESQRKAGVPRQTALIRKGLAWLDEACDELYGNKFVSLSEQQQQEVVPRLVQGDPSLPPGTKPIPVKDWLDKIRSESVAAYYSHPAVWSEIGYAGPAYPRGYVRSELGLTDPWEATRNGN